MILFYIVEWVNDLNWIWVLLKYNNLIVFIYKDIGFYLLVVVCVIFICENRICVW